MKKTFALILILALLPVSGITLKASRIESKESPGSFEKEPGDVVKKKSHTFGKIVLWTLAAAAVGAVVYFTVIKKPEYKLKVEVGSGVEGSPAAGEYQYKKGSAVSYDFRKLTGYGNLTVNLDGSPVAASGTITMDKEHTLSATALEIGSYTSITLQIHHVLKGINTGGYEALNFDKKLFIDESFYTSKIGDSNSNCTNAEVLIDKNLTLTIDKPSLYCSQLYYYIWINEAFQFFICPEFQIIIQSYTWEQGKADPGSPQIKNPQDIVFDKNKMCLTRPNGSVGCESKVTLEFVRPSNPQAAQRVFTVGCL